MNWQHLAQQDQELRQRIDEVLYFVWDPIGVNSAPEARCEYSAYVDRIYELLKESNDTIQVAAALDEFASEHMGVTTAFSHSTQVAKLLFRYKRAIELGHR